MKFRVRSNATGKKIKPPQGKDYLLYPYGQVFVVGDEAKVEGPLITIAGYTVEFAFSRDSKGKWIWSDCVVND